MIIKEGYEKQDLDKSSLQIEAGTVKKLRPEWEDYWAYNAILNEDWTQTVLTIELMKRQVDNLMKVCTDLRKFLKKCGADSSFVKDIKNVIRMGGDLIAIAIDITNNSGSPEEVIKKITGYDTDSDNGTDIDDIIDYKESETENDIIPPLEKADIVAAAKESAKEKAEEAKEKGEDIKIAGSDTAKTVAAEVAKTDEVVTATESKVNEELSKVTVDATDPTISKGNAAAGVTSAAAGIVAGLTTNAITATGTTFIKGGKTISAIGNVINIAKTGTRIAELVVNIGKIAATGVVTGIAVYAVEKIADKAWENYQKNVGDMINTATTKAAQAYLDTVQKALNEGKSLGEARAEAKAAAQEVAKEEAQTLKGYNPNELAYDSNGKLLGTGEEAKQAGSKVEDAVREALKTVEEQVGNAIERAGGDVSDYFGGCGCDDTCDCADCSSDCSDGDCDCGDCSSDCGCNDSGCSGYTPCDECTTDCSTDCPSDCSDCSSDGAPSCTSDCSSDCSTDCPSDCSDCSLDGLCDCGCDDIICGSDGQ